MSDQTEEQKEHNRQANELQAEVMQEQEHFTRLAQKAISLGYYLRVYNVTRDHIGVALDPIPAEEQPQGSVN